MFSISYLQMIIAISVLWLIVRAICWLINKRIVWKYEATLLLVYLCLLVVARVALCPFATVGGEIQPLLFDASKIFPPRINLIPFVSFFDYPSFGELFINLVGNIALFIPIGIIWPSVFKRLNTHIKVISAGVGFSLFIELLQIFFYARTTDVDDLILNTTGFLIGYSIFILLKKIKYKYLSTNG